MLHYLRIIGLGLLTGGRSMAVLSAMSNRLSGAPKASQVRGPLRLLTWSWAARLLRILMVGELVGDKLPSTPPRIESEALITRGVIGALAGALFSAAEGRSRLLGAFIGGLAALGGSFIGYYARREAVESSRLSDPVVAAIEDSIVIGGSRVLLHGVGNGSAKE